MLQSQNLEKTLIELNPWWENNDYRFKVLPRSEFKFNDKLDRKTIDIFTGARRVGKTSIMQNYINQLLDSGVEQHHIIYYVSDTRISKEIVPEDIIEFVKAKFKTKPTSRIYLFLDEVQDLNDWQRGVKYLYDNTNTKMFLSGSSSLILRAETSKLTGRFVLHEVLGLSFSEFLEFNKKTLFKSQKKNNELVIEYLTTGGYPEYVLNKNPQELRNIIESTLYRDLLSIYGIRNPAFLKDLLDYLSDKVSCPVSNQAIARDLKVNDDTAKFYLQYLQDVYLIYPLYRKGSSNRVTKSSVPKYYFNDTGVLTQRAIEPKIGLLAENAVYLHLRRQSNSKEFVDIYYQDFEGIEVDFINRTGTMYEVKFRDNLENDDLIKYQLIDQKINFVIKEYSALLSNALPMHGKITLDKFLSDS